MSERGIPACRDRAPATIAKALERPDDSIEELEAYYGKAYTEGLYS